ncbi:hypothetical protein SERLA73DRAFT_99345 [Serpula lacrymans var. lacrymans S7.3]|uniref:Uncharacterized protein n=1 Tax=Serpula lacrymans var. lacrymans (strain S7.3) TaxID=936435 RepID=F8QH23_SERL3|nr:hypothetical protein SERLA73DRAFT_99345 [Serpula lacrymans var. lacrymans S7.3]
MADVAHLFGEFTPDKMGDDEELHHEDAALAKLATLSPPTSAGAVIAVDLDDVLSQTNPQIALWHNETFGTNLILSQFYYFYYWKNPFWGPPAITTAKVKSFYANPDFDQAHLAANSTSPPHSIPNTTLPITDGSVPATNDTPYSLHTALPVPGAREGVQALRDAGFRLVIVTARSGTVRDGSWKWVEKWFGGLFDTIVCTGQFEDAHSKSAKGHEVTTKLSKKEVCTNIGAKLLIDDSLENALNCAGYSPPFFSSRPSSSTISPTPTEPPKSQSPPIPVLLFGTYPWNKRLSLSSDCSFSTPDEQVFDVRVEKTGGERFLEEDAIWAEEVLSGDGERSDRAGVYRVRDWGEVMKWVTRAREEGRL